MSETYRWPPSAITADYIRSGIAFALSALFLLLVPLGSFVSYALIALVGVFGAYLGQVFLRARTQLTLLPEGLAASGFFGTKVIRWDALDQFALRYYALRRDKEGGWMDLKLGAGGIVVTLDDRLDGFRLILERAWKAARDRDLGISSSTYANLTAAGLLQKSSV
jgi:hypothetical protein